MIYLLILDIQLITWRHCQILHHQWGWHRIALGSYAVVMMRVRLRDARYGSLFVLFSRFLFTCCIWFCWCCQLLILRGEDFDGCVIVLVRVTYVALPVCSGMIKPEHLNKRRRPRAVAPYKKTSSIVPYYRLIIFYSLNDGIATCIITLSTWCSTNVQETIENR